MKKRFLFSILLLLTASLQVMAVPARGAARTVRQPDGTEIRIVVSGDEFYRMVRTEDGAAVVKDETAEAIQLAVMNIADSINRIVYGEGRFELNDKARMMINAVLIDVDELTYKATAITPIVSIVEK